MKFVKFHCNRMNHDVHVCPEAVTVVQDEECTSWGKTAISVKGGTFVSGIMQVHVSETPEQVLKMLEA